MLTYIIILLDDSSVSYCGHVTAARNRRLIALDVLKRGIVWAMKENLNIQFVYPDYRLPEEHREAIETIDHTKIGPMTCGEELDVVVTRDLKAEAGQKPLIWQCTLAELKAQLPQVKTLLPQVERLNVMLTDIATWKQAEFDAYKAVLEAMADDLVELYKDRLSPQLNLLTDRLILHQMNNCGAGDTSVTLAPDGQFYVCPAYYPGKSVGSLGTGLDVANKQLYRLDHAPICRRCDAWQCPRCISLNEQLTGDANTPSHQQCVAAHLERNASRLLQQKLQRQGIRLQGSEEIEELSYLDPFAIATRWK